ncbi:adenosylcobinamide-phosphate synthase CbiB [Alkalihalobacillus sp. LMS39]|uniref:adenosylcobinamide-phosphate synthase CbiB n=1 Tax=Alkalihalobacillus sp. LMS39 TaxID=2924032 RepID=UPI001FB4B387|nr:adenosylcobinamide-phosphate synthase CbiB [Alkalihalobacillus sp. LMS39]UOE92406.1 adenosylcobinamide-phosphate synthase CbiB [Alkalihalobacillus sp. LMS39]
MIVNHLLALSLAFILDRVIGDPRWLPHPVVWVGKLISVVENKVNKGKYKRSKGVFFLVFILAIVFIITMSIVVGAYLIHPFFGIVMEAMIIFYAIAQKSLKDAAMEVYEPLQTGNVTEARLKLSYIVGRDTASLQEGDIVRGTVETVAENTSDGITAPLFYALLGGAPLAFLYRAINTCDSMVGYNNDRFGRFGWASAKCDDLVNWIPSRITGLIMIIVNHSSIHSKKESVNILVTDAKKHPSPNSGWGEAAVAALLGVQLGGRNTYQGIVSNRALMGRKKVELKKEHITQTVKIMARTCFAFLLFLWVIGGVSYAIARTWG